MNQPQKKTPERITYGGVEYVRVDIYTKAVQLVARQANAIRSLRLDINEALRNHSAALTEEQH